MGNGQWQWFGLAWGLRRPTCALFLCVPTHLFWPLPQAFLQSSPALERALREVSTLNADHSPKIAAMATGDGPGPAHGPAAAAERRRSTCRRVHAVHIASGRGGTFELFRDSHSSVAFWSFVRTFSCGHPRAHNRSSPPPPLSPTQHPCDTHPVSANIVS